MKSDIVNIAYWLSKKILEGVTCITSNAGNIGKVTSSHFVGRDEAGKISITTSNNNKHIEISNIVVKSHSDNHFIIFDTDNRVFIMLSLTSKLINFSDVKNFVDIKHNESFSVTNDGNFDKDSDVNNINDCLVYNCDTYVDIIDQNKWHHIFKTNKYSKISDNISDLMKKFVEENDKPKNQTCTTQIKNTDTKSSNVKDGKLEKLVVASEDDVKRIMYSYFRLHPEVQEVKFVRCGNTLRVLETIEELNDRMILS